MDKNKILFCHRIRIRAGKQTEGVKNRVGLRLKWPTAVAGVAAAGLRRYKTSCPTCFRPYTYQPVQFLTARTPSTIARPSNENTSRTTFSSPLSRSSICSYSRWACSATCSSCTWCGPTSTCAPSPTYSSSIWPCPTSCSVGWPCRLRHFTPSPVSQSHIMSYYYHLNMTYIIIY